MTSSLLKGFLDIPRVVLWPIDKLMTLLLMLLVRATSGKIEVIYNPAYNAFWIPISLYIRATGFVYRELFTPRPFLVIISIPLLIIFDILRVIIPNLDRDDKNNKAQVLESWPYSIAEVAAMQQRPQSILTGNHCPQCHKPVADHWEVCQYCGEKLEECPFCKKLISTRATQCSRCGKVIPNKVGLIRQCHACGDMLNPEWKRCARCGEPVNIFSEPIASPL